MNLVGLNVINHSAAKTCPLTIAEKSYYDTIFLLILKIILLQ